MNKIIARLAEANELKAGVIDVADWNDSDKLGKGQGHGGPAVELGRHLRQPALDFRGNRAEGDDLLGDAYEYLMRHFATESGKSKASSTRRPRSRASWPRSSASAAPERKPDHPRPDLRLGLAAAKGA